MLQRHIFTVGYGWCKAIPGPTLIHGKHTPRIIQERVGLPQKANNCATYGSQPIRMVQQLYFSIQA